MLNSFLCFLWKHSQHLLEPIWSSSWLWFSGSGQYSSSGVPRKVNLHFLVLLGLSCVAEHLHLVLLAEQEQRTVTSLGSPSANNVALWERCEYNICQLCVCSLLHRVVLLTNGTLLITQVKPRNTGTYKCVGRGLRGSHVPLQASLLIAGTHTHTQKFAVVELVRDEHL